MKGSLREIAASLNVDNAGPKHSYKTPSDCRSVVASAIMKGQDSGCMKMLQESLQHPFEFLIDDGFSGRRIFRNCILAVESISDGGIHFVGGEGNRRRLAEDLLVDV